MGGDRGRQGHTSEALGVFQFLVYVLPKRARWECLYVGKQSLKNIPNLKLKNKKIKIFPSSLKLPSRLQIKKKKKRSLISTLQGFPCSWRWKTRGPFPKMPAEGAAVAGNMPAPPHVTPGPGLCRSGCAVHRGLKKVHQENARFLTGHSGREHGTGEGQLPLRSEDFRSPNLGY